jgi:hypothetical protein
VTALSFFAGKPRSYRRGVVAEEVVVFPAQKKARIAAGLLFLVVEQWD